MECWCLHGSVGLASDWRTFGKSLAGNGFSSRAVDLWRFLACESLPLGAFGAVLNAEVGGQVFRGNGRVLIGYSMGGRLALHSLLEKNHPWQAAVIISAHPGLEDAAQRAERRTKDAEWAARALTLPWQEFLTAWEAQPVLANANVRDAAAAARLQQQRREIARSFVDWSLGAQQPLLARLASIDVPVLWLAGENDPVACDLGKQAVAKLPKGVLEIAPAAGHRLPWQVPEWFAQRVCHFLHLGA